METNKIFVMDCIEGMKKKIGKGIVDVVVTSPPYNIGIPYNTYNDNLKKEEYLDWLIDVAKEIYRVLKEDGSFFLNVGGKPSDPLLPMEIVKTICTGTNFQLQNTLHWIKSISISTEDVGDYPHIIQDIAVGHFKPVNSKRYVNNCHEYIFHLTKHGLVEIDKLALGVEYQDKSNIKRWKSAGGGLRDRGNIWFIPYKTIRESRPHPSTFPVRLAENCIKIHGLKKTKIVLDPFMGIGTTALACVRLGVNYLGFEIDKGYVEIAMERISRELEKDGDLTRAKKRRKKLYRLILDSLDAENMGPLMKELSGTGGFQSLIGKLQDQYSEKDERMILEEDDIEKIDKYFLKYGGGGWQKRLSYLMGEIRSIHRKLGDAIKAYESVL